MPGSSGPRNGHPQVIPVRAPLPVRSPEPAQRRGGGGSGRRSAAHGIAHPLVLHCRREQGPLARGVLMRRREFIALTRQRGIPPFSAQAQQTTRTRRIAMLMGIAENDPEAHARFSPMLDELHRLGWTSPPHLEILYRWAEDDPERMRAYAVELVALAPDVIVASTPASPRCPSLPRHEPSRSFSCRCPIPWAAASSRASHYRVATPPDPRPLRIR